MLGCWSWRILLCAALLAACAELPLASEATETPAPAPAESGLEGLVTIGPGCPVQQLDTPCPDAPFQATLAVLDASGAAIAQVQSDEQGYFKIALPPGTYTLQPQGNKIQHAPEQAVTVTAGQFISVTVLYDSGLR